MKYFQIRNGPELGRFCSKCEFQQKYSGQKKKKLGEKQEFRQNYGG